MGFSILDLVVPQATSDKLQATSDKQQTASDKQQTTSNKQQATRTTKDDQGRPRTTKDDLGRPRTTNIGIFMDVFSGFQVCSPNKSQLIGRTLKEFESL